MAVLNNGDLGRDGGSMLKFSVAIYANVSPPELILMRHWCKSQVNGPISSSDFVYCSITIPPFQE